MDSIELPQVIPRTTRSCEETEYCRSSAWQTTALITRRCRGWRRQPPDLWHQAVEARTGFVALRAAGGLTSPVFASEHYLVVSTLRHRPYRL